jgi:hypothetical protein
VGARRTGDILEKKTFMEENNDTDDSQGYITFNVRYCHNRALEQQEPMKPSLLTPQP